MCYEAVKGMGYGRARPTKVDLASGIFFPAMVLTSHDVSVPSRQRSGAKLVKNLPIRVMKILLGQVMITWGLRHPACPEGAEINEWGVSDREFVRLTFKWTVG